MDSIVERKECLPEYQAIRKCIEAKLKEAKPRPIFESCKPEFLRLGECVTKSS